MMRTIATFLLLSILSGSPLAHAQPDGSAGFSTGFEFSDTSGRFTIGIEPYSVTFTGGIVVTLGRPNLYSGGRFAWGTAPNGPSFVNANFNTPAEEIHFLWIAQNSSDAGRVDFFDTGGNIVFTANVTQSFTHVDVVRGPDELPLSMMTITQTAGNSVLWIDDFSYVPRLAAEEPVFQINPGLSGAWANFATLGQGFFLEVFPDIPLIFFAWFTWDTTPDDGGGSAVVGDIDHRWLTAQGPFEGNMATLQVNLTTGGIFDDPAPTVNTPEGTIKLTFTDCKNGTAEYNFTRAGVSGVVPFTRIAQDNVPLCESMDGIDDP